MINLNKMYIENRYILSFLFILIFGICMSEECTTLNPNNYGDCDTNIGYVWSGNECNIVYGCDTNGDDEFFFDNYETCDIICNPSIIIGDINTDNFINVVDIVSLVSIILNDESYLLR